MSHKISANDGAMDRAHFTAAHDDSIGDAYAALGASHCQQGESGTGEVLGYDEGAVRHALDEVQSSHASASWAPGMGDFLDAVLGIFAGGAKKVYIWFRPGGGE